MTQQSATTARPTVWNAPKLLSWLMRAASLGLLASVLVLVAYRIATPSPPHRLLLIGDVPLPGALGNPHLEHDPLAPGVGVVSDHFDFQALDPLTHQLFVAHYGVNSDKLSFIPRDQLPPGAKPDPQYDGNIVVFDTLRNQVVARIDVPHIAGIVVAPDLHKVFAANADDNKVYAIDERTLVPTAIELGDNETPDAVSYDPIDQRIFVSDTGSVAKTTTGNNPDNNPDPGTENIAVIDARTDRVIDKINIGKLPILPGENPPTTTEHGREVPALNGHGAPRFGYSVGHNAFDAPLHRLFVTTQILPDANLDNPITPLRSAELMAIDPVTAAVVQRTLLPQTCVTPHGMTIDTEQQVAFIACIEVDATRHLIANLARVDLQSMRVIAASPSQMRLAPGPDIVALDHALHLLFVACKGGVSVFDEHAGSFHKLGDYHLGKNTHTIAIDETTHEIYIPIIAGGRPVMRIAQYYAGGA